MRKSKPKFEVGSIVTINCKYPGRDIDRSKKYIVESIDLRDTYPYMIKEVGNSDNIFPMLESEMERSTL